MTVLILFLKPAQSHAKCCTELHLKQYIILMLILFFEPIQSHTKCFAELHLKQHFSLPCLQEEFT